LKCPECGATLYYTIYQRNAKAVKEADPSMYRACVKCGTIYRIKLEKVVKKDVEKE